MPSTFPSAIGISAPSRPVVVPVNWLPATLNVKVASRVWPSRAGTFAVHLPLTSAATANPAATAAQSKTQNNVRKRMVTPIACRIWNTLMVLPSPQRLPGVTPEFA